MPRIFTYIQHRGGVVDDSAAELLTAAKKIDPNTVPTAILTGCVVDLEVACSAVRSLYSEIWRVSHEALIYPNAEVVRRATVFCWCRMITSESISRPASP